ncbi:D-arabinitol 4-dehydrogenase [Commensalibacter communis]|uniref:D-arabinitol 4-dehydrogenase n=1 Tax=Commensalibacter communis TaxID=2972786 RepID=UPI0022FF7BAE|nr:D-arabinitol 4-dehydrogenase [Commensalibacter communis]CAI3936854.1 Mannitol-1-phosphate/altronate dehydrogenases (MtlD) (PDB:1LJ8) [Commensalibacter communis]CAI3941380.1 Mannitol-1-phosphate/altronate dehydrogenases (MtlD) (PDB:1LJ8) [Commensalibacter communis]
MTNIWMHIGAGSFHRAHQAWYLHRLLKEAAADQWKIAIGGIRDDVVPLLTALAQQDNEYILETVTPQGVRSYEKITSIAKVLHWDEKMTNLIEQGAKTETKIIGFTVTEGGYYLDTSHNLDPNSPDIQNELKGKICTIYGALRAILKERIKQNGNPVTLLSCDNLRHNGDRFRHGFLQFLELCKDQELAEWVKKNTTSPNDMVDRIVPRPAADLAPRVKKETGVDDKAPVMGEAFIQWVIEDNFIDGRPALEKVGAEMVEDVQPYEEAKIRILNASHSCIAWAGSLVGLSYIHEGTQTPEIKQLAWNYVTEDVIPCLTPCPLDLEDYRDVVLDRFSNPNIQDTNQRVAADGLSKLPGFITPTLVECYERGVEPKATAVLPALFYVFLEEWHKGTIPYEYQDGILDAKAMHAMLDGADPIAQFTSDKALFGSLAGKAEFVSLMRKTIEEIRNWKNNFKK